MATHVITTSTQDDERQPSGFTSRRSLLNAVGPAAMVLAGAGIGTAVAAHAAQLDADLIQVCHQFAEAEFAAWYRYVTAPDHLADAEDTPTDWATLHWITATPAVTAEGWQAKALAYAGFHRDAFDDAPDDRDSATPLLASLLRDMIAPARAAIVARMLQQYGPLPKDYTADGVWMGAEARA